MGSISMADKKYVYTWGAGKAEGDATMKTLLGGKGANLAEMSRIGLPVPAGFTITTEVCTYFYANGKSYPAELKAQVESAITNAETIMGSKFGDPANPMLTACLGWHSLFDARNRAGIHVLPPRCCLTTVRGSDDAARVPH